MSKVLFVLPAETIYEQQGRVMGWKFTPAPPHKIKELKALIPRLKELGANRVICSDLDGQSGWAIARNMGLRCEEWKILRRFNFGKHHGNKKTEADKLMAEMEEWWKANPNIPVHQGDSLTSFKRRLDEIKSRLKKQNGITVLVMGPYEIQKLTGAKAELQHGRVYEWAV